MLGRFWKGIFLGRDEEMLLELTELAMQKGGQVNKKIYPQKTSGKKNKLKCKYDLILKMSP